MKIELSEQDILNTVEFLSRAPLKGAESFTMAMLIQTFRVAIQPTETPPEEGAKNGAKPVEKEVEAKKK